LAQKANAQKLGLISAPEIENDKYAFHIGHPVDKIRHLFVITLSWLDRRVENQASAMQDRKGF
jgi:hypothetical protein